VTFSLLSVGRPARLGKGDTDEVYQASDIIEPQLTSMELIIRVQSRDRQGAGASPNELRPLAYAYARGSVL
jgi:hypothetical protein